MGEKLRDLDGTIVELITPEEAAERERAKKAAERAEMAKRIHNNFRSSMLTPGESLKSGAGALATGIMMANADPNDPDSVKKGTKMVICVFGIIITILVQAVAAYIVAFNSEFVEAHRDIVYVIFNIIEIGGLLLIICLIRAMFDRPALIKMLFDKSLSQESQKYHKSSVMGMRSVVFLILVVLIVVVAITLALLLI